jgi:hypothetical protein
MAKEKNEATKVDDVPPERAAPAAEIPAAPTQGIYTRCFLVTYSGSISRVFADSPQQAIEFLAKKKFPDSSLDEFAKLCVVRESQFVPAATEADKPYGWPRAKFGKVGAA